MLGMVMHVTLSSTDFHNVPAYVMLSMSHGQLLPWQQQVLTEGL